MASEEDILYLYLLYRIYRRNRSRQRRRVWVSQANQEREKYGILPIYPRLVDDAEEFYVYTKMSPDIFDALCTIVSPEIRKLDTNFREAIPPRERLLMTLRFLSSGESFRSLSYQFRVGTSTIRQIVYETCEAIWKRCHAKEIPPLETADYQKLSKDFHRRWNFPNCVGCVVGKKIRINCPSNSQTSDSNNASNSKSKTNRRSIILQGVSDAWGNFVAIDVGDYDTGEDSGPSIFKQTSFGRALMGGHLDLPGSEAVEGTNDKLPYVFIASIHFPLLPRLLRPFPKRDLTINRKLFNDKISYAHKCSELAFGTLVDRWGVLKSPMTMDPSQVCKIVRACCILHNFVRRRAASASAESGMSCEEDVEDVLDILPTVTPFRSMIGRPRDDAIEVRENFANFFYRTELSSLNEEDAISRESNNTCEPLLELECEDEVSAPMEEQDLKYNNIGGADEFRKFSFVEEKPAADRKPEDCVLDLNNTKLEYDFHFQQETETHSNDKVPMRKWAETSEPGREDIEIEKPTYPVLQSPTQFQSFQDPEQEIDVKPEIIYVVKA